MKVYEVKTKDEAHYVLASSKVDAIQAAISDQLWANRDQNTVAAWVMTTKAILNSHISVRELDMSDIGRLEVKSYSGQVFSLYKLYHYALRRNKGTLTAGVVLCSTEN